MADRLTQLQDCLDQLATQFYASLRYLTTRHSSAPIPHQPLHPATDTSPTQQSSPPEEFADAQRELACDLITKTKQIEYLVSVLPGLEKSEEEQEARIRVLDVELKEAEEERKEAVREREIWLERLDAVIGKVRR